MTIDAGASLLVFFAMIPAVPAPAYGAALWCMHTPALYAFAMSSPQPTIPFRTRLRNRPEWPWAWVSALAGALIAGAITINAIFASASSTAAIGFLFVWIPMSIAGLACGLWGIAMGHAVSRASIPGAGKALSQVAFVTAVLGSIALPTGIIYEAWRGKSLEAQVKAVSAMDTKAIDSAFETSPWNRNRFFLGAIARNKAAGPAVLDRIASIDDPDLFEPMGSMLWDLMGDDRKGIGTMRRLTQHPNTAGATLARLSTSPKVQNILYELLANPNTPDSVIARWQDSTDYMAEWGLALNPRLPATVYERLSRSANRYTKFNLTYNKGTPDSVLERLSHDEDELLARNAAAALERKQKAKP
jgi:hypothetical protein